MTYEEALKTAVRTVAGFSPVEREALRQHPDAVLTLAAKLAEPIVAPTVAKGPVKLIDKDGDCWLEHTNRPGTFDLSWWRHLHVSSFDYRTRDYIELTHGPVTEVTE